MTKPSASPRSALALPLFGAAALLLSGLYTAYSLYPRPMALTKAETAAPGVSLLQELPTETSEGRAGGDEALPDPDLPQPELPRPEPQGPGLPGLQPPPPVLPSVPEDQPASPAGMKRAALTFDDGPDSRYTPLILDILKAHNVKATFFVVGRQAEKHPEVLRRIAEEGHLIGNHSWDHANLSKLSEAQILADIAAGDEAVRKITGTAPVPFRAPYGAVSPAVRRALETLGRPLVGWTVDTRDWAGTPAEEIRDCVTRGLQPGGIVLMHSFGGRSGSLGNTVEALPSIIEALQGDGYTLVTADEL
ncbi:peptidoglycan/xylan/chitin deacetylase (PgdA/CDA1 family) [Paenibacillus mucilaginosus]|uniref:polysaccharide deacetylase family protein n=1 Tax=Paenibacillus mucilaginosus TaxID=61624 RepID=UPI003D1BB68C